MHACPCPGEIWTRASSMPRAWSKPGRPPASPCPLAAMAGRGSELGTGHRNRIGKPCHAVTPAPPAMNSQGGRRRRRSKKMRGDAGRGTHHNSPVASIQYPGHTHVVVHPRIHRLGLITRCVRRIWSKIHGSIVATGEREKHQLINRVRRSICIGDLIIARVWLQFHDIFLKESYMHDILNEVYLQNLFTDRCKFASRIQ